MSLWDRIKKGIKSYSIPDFLEQGPGWDIHDAYDWLPFVESGEEKARMQKLRDAYGQLPQAPGTDAFKSYIANLNTLAAQQPGEGFDKTPLYTSLMSDAEQQARRAGWATGGQLARQGAATYYGQTQGGLRGPTYGAALRAGTEQQEAAVRLRQAAASQAWQAQVQAQEQEFRRVLTAAGFDADIQSADWERKFRLAAARIGLAQAEIEAAVERQREIMGLAGQGISAYAMYKGLSRGGGGGGSVGGGSGPAGEAGGGLLPGAVG